jgi:DNA helicase-2/ATP-dependent DNA helicase PcrA
MTAYIHEEALDAEQLAAVEATEEAICVLAGPGSGKTRTLAHRARHLLLGDRAAAALLLTFTNKAAAEMKSRALGVGDIAVERLEATTFHGFGATFLRSHGPLVGIERDFEIIDAPEREEIAAGVAEGLGIAAQVKSWSNARLRGNTPGAGVASFAEVYEAAKRAENLVDFDDLIVYTSQILNERQEIASAYARHFPHILVDEFQDTSPAQFAIVSALSPYASTVSVFADDDQAIMRFAGAEARNVERFSEQLHATSYTLSRNYRCREEIVAAANRLITAGPDCSGREMIPVKENGEIEVIRHHRESDEAVAISEEIADLISTGARKPSEIAILTRSEHHVDNLVEMLDRRSVPISDWRGESFETEERRLMVSCFATISARLRSRHLERLSSLIAGDPVEETETQKFLEAHGDSPVAQELLMLRAKALDDGRPGELAAHAHAALVAADPGHDEGAMEIVSAIEDFERYDPNFTIEKVLTELALNTGRQSPTEGGGVKIATLHRTKGLQWPLVYIVGLEENCLPNYYAIQDGEVADERRVCFVGLCRAEDRVVLSRRELHRRFTQKPSRFLAEMGFTL